MKNLLLSLALALTAFLGALLYVERSGSDEQSTPQDSTIFSAVEPERLSALEGRFQSIASQLERVERALGNVERAQSAAAANAKVEEAALDADVHPECAAALKLAVRRLGDDLWEDLEAHLTSELELARETLSPTTPLASAEEEIGRAELYLNSKQYTAAADCFASIARRYPEHEEAAAFLKKAQDAYREAGNDEMRVQMQEERMEKFPDPVPGRQSWELARVHHATGNVDEALRVGREALQDLPEDGKKIEALYEMASYLRDAEGAEAQRATLEEARSLASQLGEKEWEAALLAKLKKAK